MKLIIKLLIAAITIGSILPPLLYKLKINLFYFNIHPFIMLFATMAFIYIFHIIIKLSKRFLFARQISNIKNLKGYLLIFIICLAVAFSLSNYFTLIMPNKINECESDPQISSERCYMEKAIETKSEKPCLAITYSPLSHNSMTSVIGYGVMKTKSECFYKLAVITENPNLCRYAANHRKECREETSA